MSLLKEKSILSALDEELRAQGFAGPTDIPKLVFLSLYTRYFDDPVSMVIKGPPGSGKSFALKAGLQFVPDAVFEDVSGMTPKAIVYMDNIDLKHRFMVIGEAAGLSKGKGQVFLRQLLSEHKIVYRNVIKQNGRQVTDTRTVEGPIGLLMTTTEEALHPEDESRMISYQVTGAAEIMKAGLLGQLVKKKKELDTKPWFELHEYVGAAGMDVEIPYLRALVNKLPTGEIRLSRDMPKVKNLIRAHALMHQETRKRFPKSGAVGATSEDYEVVHDLIAKQLAGGIEDGVPDNIRSMVSAVEELQKSKQQVDQTTLAGKLGRNQSIVSRWLRPAIAQGYLANNKPGQGRTAAIVLGQRKLPNGKVLPEPSELFGKEAA